MRCEEIRKQLITEARLSRLPDEVQKHLLECPDCRQAQALYAGIEQELHQQSDWQPPPGFVERVGKLGLSALGARAAKPRQIRWGVLESAVAAFLPWFLLGLLAAVFSVVVLANLNTLLAGCRQLAVSFAGALLANALPLAWSAAILSLCFTTWLTRRMLG
mgnify:CR=1 FL=1